MTVMECFLSGLPTATRDENYFLRNKFLFIVELYLNENYSDSNNSTAEKTLLSSLQSDDSIKLWDKFGKLT